MPRELGGPTCNLGSWRLQDAGLEGQEGLALRAVDTHMLRALRLRREA